MNQSAIALQSLQPGWLPPSVTLDVLRLDKLHPVVSGNKWFKLRYYLQEAVATGATTLATFGGAFSNHIVATAFACREKGLRSLGIIRGEAPQQLSHTLRQAKEYGMQLHFVSRGEYRDKEALQRRFAGVYWVGEGGYGQKGAAGVADIIGQVPHFDSYSHIVCATGTGTTLAGLLHHALPHQTFMGVSALKNNVSIRQEIQQLLPTSLQGQPFDILYDHYFGGYAKYTPALLAFMNSLWRDCQLPTDFVYTAKALYHIREKVISMQHFPPGSRLLFIHTGGLQGNLSLPAGALIF